MKLKMRKDWVYLKDLPLEEKTASGIITDLGIREGKKLRDAEMLEAEVIGISEKWEHLLPVGTKVLYLPYDGGFPMDSWDSRDEFVTKVKNVVAVIE